MGASQTFVIVALPNGIGPNGALRASLYVAPRLDGSAQLADFPDLLDWPDLIQRHGLKIELVCGPRTATVAVDRTTLRPDVWREIFKPRSLVSPYPRPDFEQRLLVSYPVRDAFAYLKWAYQFMAVQTAGPREQRLLTTVLQDLSFRDDRGSTLDETLSHLRVEMWDRQQRTGLAPAPARLASARRLAPVDGAATSLTRPGGVRPMAEQFALYHRIPPAPNRPPLPTSSVDFADTLDFHKALSALSAFPKLMRALGLVFDVELPSSLCPVSPAAPGPAYATLAVSKVAAGWNWTLAPSFSFPFTAYVRGKDAFASAPSTPAAALPSRNYAAADIVSGFLALTPDFFQLVGVDLDGGLLKAMSLAESFTNVSDPSTVEEVLPSLRSSGISLIANERAQQLLEAIRDNAGFEKAVDANAPLDRPLNARDLVRGYRLDIWSSQTRRWHSLHRRDGSYRFGADGGVVIATRDEEGFTQLALAQPADDPTRAPDPVATANGIPQPASDLYVHERVMRWNGWGLSAPRPGMPLNRSPDPSRATDPDATTGEPITPFKMQTSFSVRPGSLPRLRFGARYRLRARAVDLAGNSPALSDAVPAILTVPSGQQTLPYLRFEPVSHPVIVLVAPPGPGSSLTQLAIRSRNIDPAHDAAISPEIDERHVAPPKAPVLLVEHHGMLDDAQGHVRGDQATYDLVVQRDNGDFPKQGNTPIDPAAEIVVPYFPDPIGRGAAFAGLPNTRDDTNGTVQADNLVYTVLPDVEPRGGSVTHIDFGAGWPERRAFRLRLAESHAPPLWDASARTLTVWLPKAEQVQIPLSCYLGPADLDLMGVWNWMREYFEAREAAAMQEANASLEVVSIANLRALLTRQVLDGGHSMITPPLVITLTHAVQQPLGKPEWTLLPVVHDGAAPLGGARLGNAFSPITAWRSRGSHHAILLGGLQIHGKSSAKIDLEGKWREPIDDPAKPAPTDVSASAHVEAISLDVLDAGMVPADGSGGRFVSVYIPTVDMLWFAAPFDTLQGVTTPWAVAAPVHQFGDTKHRRVRYRAVATSRFSEYFSEPGLDFTRASELLLVDVPSSARPLAPDIVYVVPTFGWERQETTNVKTEIRFGNGLRIYLNRPWYSSGESELLGVVLWPGSEIAPDDALRERFKAYFTQWGLDPIWQTGPLAGVPSVGDFPLAAASGRGLTLEESTLAVDVCGHQVEFDAVRRLWYCDITMQNPSAYAPFIRLALARYQPWSIAGQELSHVVLADFAQLTPDRSAALSVDPANPARARLFVGGLAPEGPTRSFITVTLERRIANLSSDLGWELAPVAVAQVLEDAPAPVNPDAVLWSGTVAFTSIPPAGHFRIVIREYEILEIDPFELAPTGRPNVGERLIYASIIPYDFPTLERAHG